MQGTPEYIHYIYGIVSFGAACGNEHYVGVSSSIQINLVINFDEIYYSRSTLEFRIT